MPDPSITFAQNRFQAVVRQFGVTVTITSAGAPQTAKAIISGVPVGTDFEALGLGADDSLVNASDADFRRVRFSALDFPAGTHAPMDGDELAWLENEQTLTRRIAHVQVTQAADTQMEIVCMCFREPAPETATAEAPTESDPGARKWQDPVFEPAAQT